VAINCHQRTLVSHSEAKRRYLGWQGVRTGRQPPFIGRRRSPLKLFAPVERALVLATFWLRQQLIARGWTGRYRSADPRFNIPRATSSRTYATFTVAACTMSLTTRGRIQSSFHRDRKVDGSTRHVSSASRMICAPIAAIRYRLEELSAIRGWPETMRKRSNGLLEQTDECSISFPLITLSALESGSYGPKKSGSICKYCCKK